MRFSFGAFLGGDGQGGGLAPTVARNLRSQKEELDKILVAGAQQAAQTSRETRMNRIKDKNAYKQKAQYLMSLGLNLGQAESVLAGGLDQADEFAKQLQNDQIAAKASYIRQNNTADGFDYNGEGFGGRSRNAFINTAFTAREGADKMPVVGRDLVTLAKNYATVNNPNLDDKVTTLQAGMSILGGFYGDAPQRYAEDKFSQTYSALGGQDMDSSIISGETPYEFILPVSDPAIEAQVAGQLATVERTQVTTEGLKLHNILKSSTLAENIMLANINMKRGQTALVNENMQTLINQLELKDKRMTDKFKTDKWYEDMNTFTYQKALNDSGIYDPNTQLALVSTKMAQIQSKYTDENNNFTGNITNADDLARYNKLQSLHNGLLGIDLAQKEASAKAQDTDKGKYFKTFNDMFHKNLSVNINSSPTLNGKVAYTEVSDGVFQFTNIASDQAMSVNEIEELNRQIAEITLQVYNSTITTLEGFRSMGVPSAEQAMVNAAGFANDAYFRYTGDIDDKLIETYKGSEDFLKPIAKIPTKATVVPTFTFSSSTKFNDDSIQGTIDLFNSSQMGNMWANTVPYLVSSQVNKGVIRQLTKHITKNEFEYSPQSVSASPIKFSQNLIDINAGKLVKILSTMSTMDNGRFKQDITALKEKAKKYPIGNNQFLNLLDVGQYNYGFSFTNLDSIEIKQLQLDIFGQALDLIRN